MAPVSVVTCGPVEVLTDFDSCVTSDMSLKLSNQRHRLLLAYVCVLAVFFQCVRNSGTLSPSSNGSRTHRLRPGIARIVGGFSCNILSHPYMVSFVGYYNKRHYCGGALIGWKSVLTAGHCFKDPNEQKWDSVKAGMSLSEGDAPQEREILNIYVHPQFDAETLEHDVAVVKISEGFQPTPRVQLVELPPHPEKVDNEYSEPGCREAFTLGWGDTETTSERRKKRHLRQLQCVHLPVVANAMCKRRLNSPWIRGQVICTMDPEGEADACRGDSGGPLICSKLANSTGEHDENDTVIGVVTGGSGCGNPDVPGLNTRVDQYLDFIYLAVNTASRCGNPPPVFAVILSNISVVVCYILLFPVT